MLRLTTGRISRKSGELILQEFYAAAEGAEGGRGVVTTEPTAAEPGLVRLTIVRPAKVVPEESSAGASAAVAASPSGESGRATGGIRVDFSERRSLVAVAGSGVGEWARRDFPRLLATVCDAETKPGDAVQVRVFGGVSELTYYVTATDSHCLVDRKKFSFDCLSTCQRYLITPVTWVIF